MSFSSSFYLSYVEDTCLEDTQDASIRVFVETVLASHPSLKVVCLANDNIGPSHAEWIGQALTTNRSLKQLDLMKNDLCGDKGAESLAAGLLHNRTLEELRLDGCRAIANSLADCCLKVLNLYCNNIGDDEAAVLADMICKSNSLRKLDLSKHKIRDAGCHALAAALGRTSTLRMLGLKFNERITKTGAAALEGSVQHMNYSLEIVRSNSRIRRLCDNNRCIHAAFEKWRNDFQSVSHSLMPRALQRFETKPDLLYLMLKAKPDIIRERPNQRRRTRS